MAEYTMIDSVGLREMAEYASSLRGREGEPRFLTAKRDPATNDYVLDALPAPPDDTTDTVVVPVNTRQVQPNRAPVVDVKIYVETQNGTGVVIKGYSLDRYDAVFWSEAAVEKFLFPYYASKYQWLAAEVLTILSKVFYGYVPTLADPTQQLRDANEIPFAMAHLPRSDYVPDEPGGEGPEGPYAILARDLWVLSHVDGEVVHRPVAYYLAGVAQPG
jgi:hypothetical protein